MPPTPPPPTPPTEDRALEVVLLDYASRPIALTGIIMAAALLLVVGLSALAATWTGAPDIQLPPVPRAVLLGLGIPLSGWLWILGSREAVSFRSLASAVALISCIPSVITALTWLTQPAQLIAMTNGVMPLLMAVSVVLSGLLLSPRFTLGVALWVIAQYLAGFALALPYAGALSGAPDLLNAATGWGEALRRAAALGAVGGMTWLVTAMFREVMARLLAEERSRAALEATSEAKEAMLATMSHELRTPMNAILGYAQKLAHAPELSEDSREGVSVILHQGYDLLELINDSLDVAALEAGRLTLRQEPVDLRRLGESLITLFRPKAQASGLGLSFVCAPEVPARALLDEKRLQQILINLLGNAFKFTEQGAIRLEMAHADGALWIRVADTGVGIPADRLERVFERFEQAGDEGRRAQGSGLGLTISRRIAAAMGGTIRLESAPGEGTAAELWLPVVPEAEPSPSPEARDVLRPCADEIAWLEESALRGDMRELTRRAEALAARQPELAPFAARVCRFADEFEDAAILELLAPSPET